MMEKQLIANSQSNIIDLDLGAIRKKRFRVDGDDNRILELNTSDLNILARLKEAYPKLVDLADNAFKNLPEIEAGEDYDFWHNEATTEVIETLKKADMDMRELMDYILNQ